MRMALCMEQEGNQEGPSKTVGSLLRGRCSWRCLDTTHPKDEHHIQAQAQLSVWEAQQERAGMSQLEGGAQQQGIQEP